MLKRLKVPLTKTVTLTVYVNEPQIYVSQLCVVDPSALANSPPAIGWRPASRGRLGATHDGCDLYTFLLRATEREVLALFCTPTPQGR